MPERRARAGARAHDDVLIVVEGIPGEVGVLEREDPAVRAYGERAAAERRARHQGGPEPERDGIDFEDPVRLERGIVRPGVLYVQVAARGGDRQVRDRARDDAARAEAAGRERDD